MRNSLLVTCVLPGALLATVGFSGAARAQDVPATPIVPATPATPAQDPASRPAKKKSESKIIYDEKADAKQQIAAAVAKAKEENRRVLIQWGGNWCSWCQLLHATFKSDAKIARELMYEYDVVMVDIGHFDKNAELAKSLGAEMKVVMAGAPFLTILDGEGKPIVNQPTDPLELTKDEKGYPGHNIDKVLEFLKSNETKPLAAENVLKSALADARKSEKTVFLHFGAPW
ncbi:MAG: thioredoxin family protein [Planctomycetes bacterium]|nr:thioredoxin family protein [Planctomycetota bacterium]